MREELVLIETWNLAMEKGFNEDIVPTQSLLQKWLRKKHFIKVRVASNSRTSHFPMTELLELDGTKGCGPSYLKNYKTYEKALEKGLYEALKLIKE